MEKTVVMETIAVTETVRFENDNIILEKQGNNL